MVSSGAVRIGTLNYYRRREAEDTLRGDLSEGTAAFLDAPEGIQSSETLSPLTREWFEAPEGAILRRNVWRTNSTVSDRFVFCASAELSTTAAGAYDSCVEITDVLGFLGALTGALNDAVVNKAIEAEGHLAPITYIERQLSAQYHGYLSPAFIKEPRFRIEQEVRLVWEAPRPKDVEYVDITCKQLARFTRRVDIPV
jgi:hypothetical protein